MSFQLIGGASFPAKRIACLLLVAAGGYSAADLSLVRQAAGGTLAAEASRRVSTRQAGGVRHTANQPPVCAAGAAIRVHLNHFQWPLRAQPAGGRRSPWTARDAPVAPMAQASTRVPRRQAGGVRHTAYPPSAFAVGLAWVSQQTPSNLTKIEVRGAERLSAERVIESSGLKTGQSVDRGVLQSAVERMMATGLFERVNWRTQPGEDGVTVTLTIREAQEPQVEAGKAPGPKIEMLEVRGLTPERNEILRKRLEAPMAGRVFSAEMAEEVAGPLVRAALAEWGHWSPAVKFGLEAGSVLVITVQEGPAALLGEVTLEGGEAKWLDGAGYAKGAPAESKKLYLALGKVIQAARNSGYLTAAARSENSVTGGRLNVKISMEMGPLYRFGELRIEGLDAQREKRARALWKLKPGDAAGASALEEWIRLVFERRIPVWDRVERAWRPRQGEAIADAAVSFR